MIWLSPIFFVWGSFLNMLGYRLVSDESLLITRSFCPSCKHHLAWYDLIPLFSWISLKGKCRYCKTNISWIYPFIELLTPLICISLLLYIQSIYWFAYLLFSSALLVTIRTDLSSLLISRFSSLYLIPIGYILSMFELLPLSLNQSVIGSLTAYLFLLMVSSTFTFFTGKIGMGQGDIELLAMIGAFTGIVGWWTSLVCGSFIGSIIGLIVLFFTQAKGAIKLPFGVFLSLGAMIYLLFGDYLLSIFIL